MNRLISALVAGSVGAGVALFALVLLYQRSPAIRLEFDRDLPSAVTGLYAPERHESLTFAWTSGRAEITFRGADRRLPWACRVPVVNWRPATAGPAKVDIEADGIILVTRQVSAPAETLAFTVPASPGRAALGFAISVAPTFRPGGGDPRELGLAVDAVRCEPAPGRRPWPARALLVQAAVAAGVFGAAAGAAGLPVVPASLVAAGAAGLQAIPLTTGLAPYAAGTPPAWRLAGLLVVVGGIALVIAEASSGRRLSTAARLVIVLSGLAAYLKLLFLLHPDKALVDALFHAHRLQWVLEGRFYFTQLSTSATPFPYAIGLYLAAAPWTVLTGDHVTLLRVVVCVAEAIAGGLLYLVIARTWRDEAAGVFAVVLASLVPLGHVVVGHANLTHAFGQAVALVTVAAATILPLGPGSRGQLAGLSALATLGLLSHVSTLVLLLAVLLALALFYRWLGGPALRRPARSIAAAALLALLLAVGLYWGHFGEVYWDQLTRARTGAAARSAAGATPSSADPTSALGRTVIPLHRRALGALEQTGANIGWPMLILAATGAWRLWRERARDRLVFALLAWGATALAFTAFAVLAPGDVRYQQDAWEFIGRVQHAASPAAVVLAAAGSVWLWRRHVALRVVAAVLLMWAFVVGGSAVYGWIR